MKLISGIVLAAMLASGCASQQQQGGQSRMPPADRVVVVKEVGSFHVGGRQVTLSGLPEKELVFSAGAAPRRVNPNGDFEVGQMYVQYIRLDAASRKGRYPLLMWHGGGLSGVTWESKPDGQPGWQSFFLQAGHDVYVSDAVERGRASWARYPEIFETEPVFRTKQEAWELFRIGPPGSYATDPGKRQVFAQGTQFPVEAFDQFTKQGIPRWASNDAATQAAYDQYVQKVCPCVIVVHSQGGNFVFNAALRAPDKIRGVVAIEPSGSPDPEKVDLSALKGIPFLFIWGDYLDRVTLWTRASQTLERFEKALQQQGTDATRIDLPKLGVHGNSHMLMMDRNSDEIAQRVQNWLVAKGLSR
ncbi:esterase [Verminephrobacter aporrectodeae subsp. tuberculatae]|uniref:esterase n=1 Tax=Verminephrobacter aporrectodeae TaxID=1110389 RepID=UPI0022434CC8|nr:esterase [Verminephrobacter aporrectodeae]MCW8166685.1 esterase [Verminephrobacter aporrectodeae subsp. tuberculatae]MCW8170477.1 esterase [Verminephrobacter aporrectodeae subsp. tuberculatae]